MFQESRVSQTIDKLVTMSKRIMAVVILSILFAGCDTFPGSNLRSEYRYPVTLTVSYDNGKSYTHVLRSCQTLALGASVPGRFGMKAGTVKLVRIRIRRDGKTLLDLDKAAIDNLTKNSDDLATLVVKPAGVAVSNRDECSVKGEASEVLSN